MTTLLVATQNDNKRRELKSLFRSSKDIKVVSLKTLKTKVPTIIENGKTFRQNSVKKSVTTSKFFDGLVLADDSGLEVKILDGKPGVRSARFARTNATDAENNTKLLKLLDKVPAKDRAARFVCYLTLAKDGILLDSFEGIIEGKILTKGRGSNGFGYDPLFIPKGKKTTFAEMTATSKNRISHRALALKLLKKSIKKYT